MLVLNYFLYNYYLIVNIKVHVVHGLVVAEWVELYARPAQEAGCAGAGRGAHRARRRDGTRGGWRTSQDAWGEPRVSAEGENVVAHRVPLIFLVETKSVLVLLLLLFLVGYLISIF